jgi:hypothetical protein
MSQESPLSRVDKAVESGVIPPRLGEKIVLGFRRLKEAISSVEKASGIPYPRYFIEPYLVVVHSGVEFGQLGIIYARNRPMETQTSGIEIVVEFSAALLALASKATIEAVTAHEFTHYLDLVGKFSAFNLTSDSTSDTLFESTYSDYERLIDASLVFGKRSRLVKLIQTKMPTGLHDAALEKKTVKIWLERKMPTVKIPPQSNVISLSSAKAATFRADPKTVEAVSKILKAQKKNLG